MVMPGVLVEETKCDQWRWTDTLSELARDSFYFSSFNRSWKFHPESEAFAVRPLFIMCYYVWPCQFQFWLLVVFIYLMFELLGTWIHFFNHFFLLLGTQMHTFLLLDHCLRSLIAVLEPFNTQLLPRILTWDWLESTALLQQSSVSLLFPDHTVICKEIFEKPTWRPQRHAPHFLNSYKPRVPRSNTAW